MWHFRCWDVFFCVLCPHLPRCPPLAPRREVLIEKHWHGPAKRTIVDLFWEIVLENPNRRQIRPILSQPKFYLANIQRFGMFVLGTVSRESPPLMVLEFMHRIVDVLAEYLGGKVTETSLRDNFSLVYQLLEEMVDAGCPFTTEGNQLKEMILPPTVVNKVLQQVVSTKFQISERAPGAAVSKMPWRRTGVKYVTNEVYFDLIEQVDVIIDSSASSAGAVSSMGSGGFRGVSGGGKGGLAAGQKLVKNQIFGVIQSDCRLSGVPDLSMSFNHPGLLNDVSLHRCVRISRFQRDKVVSFVPPDGDFKLLTYKVSGGSDFRLPIFVAPSVDLLAAPGSGKLSVVLGRNPWINEDHNPLTHLVVKVDLPSATLGTTAHSNNGTVRLDNATKCLTWNIGTIPANQTSVRLEGQVSLPADWKSNERVTLRVEFVCKSYSCTGIKVTSLTVRGVNYKPRKGARTVTQNGRFEIRC